MSEFDDFYYGLAYDASINSVVMVLKGYFNSHLFREITENLLRLIVRHKVNKVLADTTHMNLIGAEDQKWLNEDFLPRAIKQGYKTCAMIKSKYHFGRISLQAIADKMDKSAFDLQFFDEKDSAIVWLKNYSATIPAYVGK